MIIIKHNIKRDGCTLSGQILSCKFSGEDKRSTCFKKKGSFILSSISYPEIRNEEIFVWGYHDSMDSKVISYTYPTEYRAKRMLSFINSFVDKKRKPSTKLKRTSK